MSKLKKTFVIILSISVVVLISIAGTLAYLLSEAKTEYNFTVPTVDVQLMGVGGATEQLSSSQSSTVGKNPTVKNTSNAPAYLRVQVLVNGGHLDEETAISSIVTFGEGSDWDWSQWGTNGTGYIYYKGNGGILQPGEETSAIFNTIDFNPTAAAESPAGKAFDVQINVSAVQADFYPPLTGTPLQQAEEAFSRIQAA